MDLFLHCVHHLWLCTVWNEVWTQHVITSITTDQNNQTLITSSYFQRNEIFRSNTQICAGSTSPGWPTVTPTPPLTAPQIVNSPTLTGEKMSRRRSWSHKNNNNIMMVILIIIKIPALPGLPSHLPSPPATRWPRHILWLDLAALRGFYQGNILVKIPWTNKIIAVEFM